jgi:polyisoprenyl-teichoic acid--peptidoglycan teichoic acid transferase
MQYQKSYPASSIQSKPRLLPRLLKRLLLLLLLSPLIGFVILFATSRSVRDAVGVVLRGELAPARAFPGRERVDLLVLGRDRDINNRKQVMKTRGRSDLIMLTRMDFENRAAYMLSIPRDTWVRLPRSRRHSKINAAYAIGGARYAARTVEGLIGVRPAYMATLDYQGFVKAIDALGGVEVTVDRDMEYDDDWGDLHIHLKRGRQRLNGEQALGFVRFRHADRGPADSDFKRAERQQRLLAAIKERVRNPLTWLRLPYAMDAVRPYLSTNLTFGQLLCLGAFVPRVPQPNLRQLTLPSRSSGALVYPNRERLRELMRKYFQVDAPR